MKLSDSEVLHIIKSGGPRVHKVMDFIYLNSRSKIIRYVMKNGGSKEDGQDTLQDAVAAFYSNIITNKYRGESDIGGYIFGIARNIWLKSLNKKGKAKDLKKADLLKGETAEKSLDEDTTRHLNAVLQKMDDVCRDLLIHAFYFNYSAEELRKKFDFKNEQVARNKKYKCLKKLRELMDKFKITQA